MADRATKHHKPQSQFASHAAANEPPPAPVPVDAEQQASRTTPSVEALPGGPLGLEAPAGNPRFPLIDPLRGIAAAGVFLYHFANVEHANTGVLGRIFDHGNFGVTLFFLISGFLLYRPFVTAREQSAPRIKPLRFYERRALRIIPAYWAALTILALTTGVPAFHGHWWQLYLFGQIYDPNTTFAGIGPAWSLCIEVSFYVLLPFYAYAAARALRGLTRRAALWGELGLLGFLAIASALAHQLIHDDAAYTNLAYTLPGTFYLFAMGMALAVLSVRWQSTSIPDRIARSAGWWWCAAIAIYVIVALEINYVSLGSVHPLYGLIALLILVPATVPAKGRLARVLKTRALLWLGLVSYGFYLWHQVVIEQVARHVHSAPAVLIVAALVTTVIAAASYYLVEAPWLRIKTRLAGRRVAKASFAAQHSLSPAAPAPERLQT